MMCAYACTVGVAVDWRAYFVVRFAQEFPWIKALHLSKSGVGKLKRSKVVETANIWKRLLNQKQKEGAVPTLCHLSSVRLLFAAPTAHNSLFDVCVDHGWTLVPRKWASTSRLFEEEEFRLEVCFVCGVWCVALH